MSDVTIAVIGGTGFYDFPELDYDDATEVSTPFGLVSGVRIGLVANKRVAFITRHGLGRNVAPHLINYRANVYALKSLGVQKILAVNAVGGISQAMAPRTFVLPDQIIDYTYGREHTYASLWAEGIQYVDFTHPFTPALQQALAKAFTRHGLKCVNKAVLGCTQGPRLETAAEVQRLKRDGCDLVGMTSMPEAALARELNMDYGSVCTVVNWAAGIVPGPASLEEIFVILTKAAPILRKVLLSVVDGL